MAGLYHKGRRKQKTFFPKGWLQYVTQTKIFQAGRKNKMILNSQYKAAFAEYEAPLRQLEKAFDSAGMLISFGCFVAAFNNKMVEIYQNKKRAKIICIEGDSPAQAVKDVAQAVAL
jgi:hypothetical protein